jgi:hypothetical protein
MARPRLPTAVLELRGAFKNHPSRGKDRADEPKPTTKLGKPPVTFNAGQRKAWLDFETHGFWLTGADRFMVEVAVKLMAQHRANNIEPKEISILVGTLNKLGFGPAERSKIKAPGAKEDKPEGFAAFK